MEDYIVEIPEEPTRVYNFQVEDFHTYYVGENYILVHNANCTPGNRQAIKEHLEGTANNTGPQSNGAINGCHEENVFLDKLDISGGELTSRIDPINGMDGVTYVEYKTASGDVMKKLYTILM